MHNVASLFRDAVQVTPMIDDEDALPAVSMVALPDELLQHIFRQACNALEPRRAVALSSASHGLWAVTQEGRQQLRADHEAAAVLCLKVGLHLEERDQDGLVAATREGGPLVVDPDEQDEEHQHAVEHEGAREDRRL